MHSRQCIELLLCSSSNYNSFIVILPLKHSRGLFKKLSRNKRLFIPLRYFYSPGLVPDEAPGSERFPASCLLACVFNTCPPLLLITRLRFLVLDVVACGSSIVKRSFLCFFIPSAPPFPPSFCCVSACLFSRR